MTLNAWKYIHRWNGNNRDVFQQKMSWSEHVAKVPYLKDSNVSVSIEVRKSGKLFLKSEKEMESH